jgi:hypothetical protein
MEFTLTRLLTIATAAKDCNGEWWSRMACFVVGSWFSPSSCVGAFGGLPTPTPSISLIHLS